MISLNEYFNFVHPDLDPAIAGPASLEAMATLAPWLPASSVRKLGYECRLNDPVPRLDLSLALGREGASGLLRSLPRRIAGHPVWAGIRRFAEAWAEPSALGNAVQSVWLEFDLVQPWGSEALPGFIFALDESVALPRMAPVQLQPLVAAGLRAVLGGEPPAPLMACLANCLRELPGQARLAYVGLMLSRKDPVYRMCLLNLPAGQTLPYLERIGWGGDRARLAEVLAWFERRTDRTLLDLDVGAGGDLLPSAAIEGLRPAPGPEGSPLPWAHWLDDLCAGSLCLPAKRDGLRGFTGCSRVRDDRLWPADPLGIPGRRPRLAMIRAINHIKLGLKPEGPVEAKAYLGVRPLRYLA
ncbi:MAG: hypothetical protein P4L36_02675 [Holophaga sp.]|nr:hypothetical protein [Holophaga sp.]